MAQRGGSITLNPNSFFFTGAVNGTSISDILTRDVRKANGLGDLNADQVQELVILHELMHINDVDGKYDDLVKGGNPDLNKLIRDACF